MAIHDSLDPLVDRIYAAALQPDSWGEVISAVGGRIGATSGTSLWFGRGGLDLIRAEVWNVDPDALTEYQQHYLAFCPRFRISRGLEVGAIYDDRPLRAVEDARTRDYYAFMDRFDLGMARIALAEKRPGLTIGMNFYNSASDGLSPDGEQILALLAPHFRRACNLTQAFADVQDRAALGEAWFHARTASLTLDARGAVVRMNAAAERLCNLADGLTVAQGHLTAASAVEHSRLDRELARALGGNRPDTASRGDFILISRPSGQPAFAVSAVPLPRSGQRERAIVTIAPTVPDIAPACLQRAFGFTPSQACVAVALCQGRSPEQIAADRGVSLHTVRSQIKAIFLQLDVGTQTELVSRVTAAALGARP